MTVVPPTFIEFLLLTLTVVPRTFIEGLLVTFVDFY